MHIAELIEIALANSDERRVEVAALEPAEVSLEAVSNLAQLVAELVDNALAFSAPEDVVRVTGLHDQGNYLISISDRGVGLPEDLMTELNRLLQDPSGSAAEPRPGISLVARLASRHGFDVRLVPGAPGTTARVTVPGRLVSETKEQVTTAGVGPRGQQRRLPPDDALVRAGATEEKVDLTRFQSGHRIGSGVIAMSEEARREAEAFLEKVFAPLMESRGLIDRPPPRPSGDNGSVRERSEPEQVAEPAKVGTVTELRVRVPGENFSLVEDDPSIVAAEGAIDIRSALSRYQQGKRSAEESPHHL